MRVEKTTSSLKERRRRRSTSYAKCHAPFPLLGGTDRQPNRRQRMEGQSLQPKPSQCHTWAGQMPHLNRVNATPEQGKRHTSRSSKCGIDTREVWHCGR